MFANIKLINLVNKIYSYPRYSVMKKHILAFRVVMYVKFFVGLWKQSFLLLLVQLTNFKKQFKKKKS